MKIPNRFRTTLWPDFSQLRACDPLQLNEVTKPNANAATIECRSGLACTSTHCQLAMEVTRLNPRRSNGEVEKEKEEERKRGGDGRKSVCFGPIEAVAR